MDVVLTVAEGCAEGGRGSRGCSEGTKLSFLKALGANRARWFASLVLRVRVDQLRKWLGKYALAEKRVPRLGLGKRLQRATSSMIWALDFRVGEWTVPKRTCSPHASNLSTLLSFP